MVPVLVSFIYLRLFYKISHDQYIEYDRLDIE